MRYPYETAKNTSVGIALWILERHEWNWRPFYGSKTFSIRRSKVAAKTAALIAHDRILTGEVFSRGLPSSYGRNGARHG